jgi:acetylornithine deacetylase/succinyl-diaminopimelate desuccinylase-like protein
MALRSALSACGTTEEAVALLSDLVRVKSYPGEERAAQEVVAAWLRDHGLLPEYQQAGEDRPNIIATIRNGPGPTLLINGHTDTVLEAEGWDSNPWEPRIAGNRLYGLGACDMKSGVVAMLLAGRALDQHRDCWSGTVIISSVVDEEAYSLGAHALIDGGLKADYAIVTESTGDTPCVGSIGKVLVQVDVTGKAAHASWPDRGINAAIELAKFVALLESVPIDEHPRMKGSQTILSSISGSAQYVITVPEKARALVNRHTVPGESVEMVLERYQAVVDQLQSPATFELSVQPPFYPPWETEIEAPITRSMHNAFVAEQGKDPEYGYWGFGDMNLFSGEAGIPTVVLGPAGAGFHEKNEWVDIESIVPVARMIVRMTADLLPAGSES